MNRRQRILLAFGLFDLILLALVVILLGYINSPERQTHKLAELGVARYVDTQTVNGFSLLRHDGGQFTQADFKGKWHLVFFGFTHCPDFCPLTMQALDRFYADLQDSAMVNDTQVVMITVDPARDTPAVLAEYLADFDDSFIGLTGAEQVIRRLADQLHITFMKPDSHEDHDYVVQHSDYIVVIDPEGKTHSVMGTPFTRDGLRTAYAAIRGL